jgi:hypothetical protein
MVSGRPLRPRQLVHDLVCSHEIPGQYRRDVVLESPRDASPSQYLDQLGWEVFEERKSGRRDERLHLADAINEVF